VRKTETIDILHFKIGREMKKLLTLILDLIVFVFATYCETWTVFKR